MKFTKFSNNFHLANSIIFAAEASYLEIKTQLKIKVQDIITTT